MTVGEITPVTTNVGAVVDGVDLCQPLDADTVEFLRTALSERGVLFLRDQDITREQLGIFAEHFGVPGAPPLRSTDAPTDPISDFAFHTDGKGGPEGTTDLWHTDTSYMPVPPVATALRAVTVPPVGGDTCWASMTAAYDALSAPLRTMIDQLTAVHSSYPVIERLAERATRLGLPAPTPRPIEEQVHPVVLTHPATGHRALFVNEAWTTRIVELTRTESTHLLALLFDHIKSPNFSLRWSWSVHDVAIWDNRAVQHYAVPDYAAPRVMHRVVMWQPLATNEQAVAS